MTLKELCEKLDRSESYFKSRKFADIAKNFEKRGIIITKEGKGKTANYTVQYNDEYNNYLGIPEKGGYPKIALSQASNAKNLTGQTFGRLKVLYRTEPPKNVSTTDVSYWLCECSCEKHSLIVVSTNSLTKGNTQSCGCLQKEYAQSKKIHLRQNLAEMTFGKLTVLKEKDNEANDNRRYWICECNCQNHNIIIVEQGNLTSGHTQSCGCIGSSKGEDKISIILKENNIKFEAQKTFDSCRFEDTNALARFDFYLPDYNILIEYDGRQHFYFSNSGWNTEENFKKTQDHDKYKTQWCKDNNILLIRIPYTKYDNLTIKDLIKSR